MNDELMWAEGCDVGDYLIEYDECGIAPEDDPGSRCGYDDATLAAIEAVLRGRGMTLVPDDTGLVAAFLPHCPSDG